uniref:Uncharacterized protein n=1 Tax=Craspedostauros australis TaxID=1486917 RepID=A0A7R9ZR83_9STRA
MSCVEGMCLVEMSLNHSMHACVFVCVGGFLKHCSPSEHGMLPPEIPKRHSRQHCSVLASSPSWLLFAVAAFGRTVEFPPMRIRSSTPLLKCVSPKQCTPFNHLGIDRVICPACSTNPGEKN